MLTLIKHGAALELKPSPELIQLARDGEVDVWDALEWHIGNGWSFVPPEDIGALTDGIILSDEGAISDDGRWEPYAPEAAVYWHARYQVEDPVATWAEGKSVFFEKH